MRTAETVRKKTHGSTVAKQFHNYYEEQYAIKSMRFYQEIKKHTLFPFAILNCEIIWRFHYIKAQIFCQHTLKNQEERNSLLLLFIWNCCKLFFHFNTVIGSTYKNSVFMFPFESILRIVPPFSFVLQ